MLWDKVGRVLEDMGGFHVMGIAGNRPDFLVQLAGQWYQIL